MRAIYRQKKVLEHLVAANMKQHSIKPIKAPKNKLDQLVGFAENEDNEEENELSQISEIQA